MLRSARVALCLVPALLAVTSVARADDPPPQLPAAASTPPPGYGQPPPPGYGQPPPGYYPPPGGYYPPPGTPPPQADPRPAWMEYDEDQPIPQGYHLRTKVRGGLIGGGAGLLGGLWVVSVITGAIGEGAYRSTRALAGDTSISDGGWASLYFPIVGPFAAIGTLNADGGGAAILALDGIGQLGGAAMIVLGIVLPKKTLVRDSMFEITPSVAVTPVFTGKSVGLVGTF